MEKYKKTSQYLAYLLRHAPETAELDMDQHGWVDVTQLLKNAKPQNGTKLTLEMLQEIVTTDNKGRYRFSADGKKIKACQGHSIPWVEPELEIRTPPEYLYHGTTTEALNEIMESGAILRMSRHAVHMQEDISKAWDSATRRKNKKPVVIKIAAGDMAKDGFQFSISENGVWFCETVPKKYFCGLRFFLT